MYALPGASEIERSNHDREIEDRVLGLELYIDSWIEQNTFALSFLWGPVR